MKIKTVVLEYYFRATVFCKGFDIYFGSRYNEMEYKTKNLDMRKET